MSRTGSRITRKLAALASRITRKLAALASRTTRKLAALAALFAPLVVATGCATTPSDAQTKGIHIVAAENFWGSIAGQLAGTKATVQSIITDPAQDPHSYEPR